ncbi:7-cyano-7-deazaguanine synthase [Lacibacter sp. H407]|uniref:7-cyano-7-deazaguanine synthase n=1 Tax=Lacibacter sp. H407 TaxID=3133423 RepID=UPI0030C0F147
MAGILLASGGLDSTTLAYWLLDKKIEFHVLFIDYGQHFAKTEFETLKAVLPKENLSSIEIVNVSSVYAGSTSKMIIAPDLWNDEINADDLYLPYRNIFILTIGAIAAQKKNYDTVYSAFINSNHAKEIDCSNDFFNQLESILKDFGAIKIEMPFRYMSKYQVAKLGIELGAPIGKTFSCQASPSIPCGACPNCVDRLEAFRLLSNS